MDTHSTAQFSSLILKVFVLGNIENSCQLLWSGWFGDLEMDQQFLFYETPIGKTGAVICWEKRMPLLKDCNVCQRETWQASMIHVALEGGCFVLSANQFCPRKDYPPELQYVMGGTDENLTPDCYLCWWQCHYFTIRESSSRT